MLELLKLATRRMLGEKSSRSTRVKIGVEYITFS